MPKKLNELSEDEVNEIIEKYELDKDELESVTGGDGCDSRYVPTPDNYSHPLGTHIEIYWMWWGDSGWWSHGGTVTGLAYRDVKDHTFYSTELYVYVNTGEESSGWYADANEGIYRDTSRMSESALTILVAPSK